MQKDEENDKMETEEETGFAYVEQASVRNNEK